MQETTESKVSGGMVIKTIKKVYEAGEQYFEIDGQKFGLQSIETMRIDGNLRKCDIVLRQIITPQSSEIKVIL